MSVYASESWSHGMKAHLVMGRVSGRGTYAGSREDGTAVRSLCPTNNDEIVDDRTWVFSKWW